MSAVGPEDHGAHGFDFLHDPVLVVTLKGDIVETNGAARSLFGPRLDDGKLANLIEGNRDGCTQYLRLASGSTEPRPGKLLFATPRGVEPRRTQAARSRQKADRTLVIVQLLPVTSDRFALLDRRVRDLDAKLHERLQENTALREALSQNKSLLRELQHRVKNNIQQMMTLIRLGATRVEGPEVAQMVRTAHGRLSAMAAAQEAIYQTNAFDVVPAHEVLQRIILAAARSHGASDAISMALDDVLLTRDEAHCLALIANELVTNAARHGLQNGEGHITVTFSDDGDSCALGVNDTGPGIPEDVAPRASGLALVRNLCRQIGGRLDISRGTIGAGCTVHFRPARQKREHA